VIRPPEVVQASRDQRGGFVVGGGRALSAFWRWQSDLSPNVGVDGGQHFTLFGGLFVIVKRDFAPIEALDSSYEQCRRKMIWWTWT
jgi:hypothetical protein